MITGIKLHYKRDHYRIKIPSSRSPIFLIAQNNGLRLAIIEGIYAALYGAPPANTLGKINSSVITCLDGSIYRYPAKGKSLPPVPEELFKKIILGINPLPDSHDLRLNRLLCEKAKTYLQLLSDNTFIKFLWDVDGLTVVDEKKRLHKYDELSLGDRELVKFSFRFIYMHDPQSQYPFFIITHSSLVRLNTNAQKTVLSNLPSQNKQGNQIIITSDFNLMMQYPFFESDRRAMGLNLVPFQKTDVAKLLSMRNAVVTQHYISQTVMIPPVYNIGSGSLRTTTVTREEQSKVLFEALIRIYPNLNDLFKSMVAEIPQTLLPLFIVDVPPAILEHVENRLLNQTGESNE
jgi:hypothetical protein